MKLLDLIGSYISVEEDIREFFTQGTTTRTFSKGEILCEQGKSGKNIFFIQQGLVRSFYLRNGRDITFNFYPEVSFVANVDSLFRSLPTRYNIQTLEESTITFCNYEELQRLCEKSLSLANLSLFLLGRLMDDMVKRISSLQFMSAKERYEYLLRETPSIILRAPLGMVASYLGITQETLSRIRKGTKK